MFQKLKYKLIQFMYGRYGVDELYKALLVIFVALATVNIFISSKIIHIILTAVFVWMIFRMLSKNHAARAGENRAFLKTAAPIKRFFSVNCRRIRDIRTKRYRVCPKCKATVRLPVKRGKHSVRCPKCGDTFKVNILF